MENLTTEAMTTMETDIEQSNTTHSYRAALKPAVPEYIFLINKVVQNYVTLVVLVLGFVFNIWAMVLMKKPRVRVTVMSLYLFTLALSDTGFLITMLLRQSFKYFNTGVDLNLLHRASCALLKYVQEFFLAYSSWIVTAISIERTLVVKLPLRAVTLSTKRKAKITLGVMALVIAVLFCHALFMPDVIFVNGKKKCFVEEMYTYFEVYVRFPLMGALTSYIPIVILTVCTTLLIHSLAKAKAERQKLSTNIPEKNSNINRCTVTAVVICISFWILSSASMIMFLVMNLKGWHNKPVAATYVVRAFTALILTTRGSVNFLLYILSSSSFRKEVCCCDRPTSHSMKDSVRATTRTTLSKEMSISTIGTKESTVSKTPEDAA